MSVQMIQDRLDRYQCRSTLEEEHALREITQETVLAGLGRTDFFKRAGFHGGTCLRVFYGIARFSEDLDFALHSPDPGFDLAPYLRVVVRELTAYGYELEIDERSRAPKAVRQAFLKDDSIGHLLRMSYRPTTGSLRKLRVKLEVDANPPEGAAYETKYLDYPFPAAIRVFDAPSLFAGKLHALLCRDYLKGRDWYDFIWYTARRTPVNYRLLSAALDQTGPWQGRGTVTDAGWCAARVRGKIEVTDWARARDDVRRFLKVQDLPSLELWSRDFFLAQCEKQWGRPATE